MDDIVGGRDAEGKEVSADEVRAFLKKHDEKGNLPYGHPASVSKTVPFSGFLLRDLVQATIIRKHVNYVL